MGDILIDRALKSLAIAGLVLFIICSMSWLMERPNRYQLIMAGDHGLTRLDTCTGKMELIVPPYKVTLNLTEYKKPMADESVKTTEELFGPQKPPVVDPDKK